MKGKYFNADGSLNISAVEKELNEIKDKISNYIDFKEFIKIRSRLYYLKRVCVSNADLSNKISNLINGLKKTSDDEDQTAGLYIDNVRIIKLDDLNYIFEIYRKVKNREGLEIDKWVADGGYYGSLTSCLTAVKNKVISEYIKLRRISVSEFIKLLEKINNAVISVIIKIKE